MTAQDWLNVALSGSPVWDIGQLDKTTKRQLDRLVRDGKLSKSKLCWMNLGRPRSVWHLA